MRRASGAHDVVDPGRMEAALAEHAHAGVEQPAHRLATLGAELARLRRRAGRVGRVASGSGTSRRLVRFAHIAHAAPDDCRSGPPIRGSYCVRHTGRLVALVRGPRPHLRRSGGRARATRRTRRRRRCAGAATRPGVPARILRRCQARRDHGRGQRSAVGSVSASQCSTSPIRASSSMPTSSRRPAAPRRCCTTLRAHGESPPVIVGRSRPSRRDHLHVGHDRDRRRARCTATASSRSSPRPTSATDGTAADVRSAARRSRTSAS